MSTQPAASSPENEATLTRLLDILTIADGHMLLFARCNILTLRNRVIAAARTRLGDRRAPVHTLRLTTTIDHPLQWIETHLPPPDALLEPGAILFLVGMEHASPPAGSLSGLRADYERLRAIAPLPVVFWLPEYAISALEQRVPAVWSMKSGVYEFDLTPTRHRHQPEYIQPGASAPALHNLSAEEKRQQLRNFEAQLSTFADEGTPHWMRMRLSLLRQIGEMNEMLGDFGLAQRRYEAALLLARDLLDEAAETDLLTHMGLVFQQQGQTDDALAHLQTALTLHLRRDEPSGQASVLAEMASILSHNGECVDALNYYEWALHIQRNREDSAGQAAILNNMGLVYNSLDERDDALDCFEQALPLYQSQGDIRGEGTTLNNIGTIYSAQGQKERALHYFHLALSKRQIAGDRIGEATTLNNMGMIYDELGQKRKALRHYRQALPLRQALGDRNGEATTLNNIAIVLEDLGQRSQALHFFEQALPLYREAGNRAGEATILNNLGGLYFSMGDRREALRHFEQTLYLRRSVGDRSGEATTLNNLGLVYMEMGKAWLALEYYADAANAFADIGDLWSEAVVRSNIGVLHVEAEAWASAARQLQRAVAICKAVNHPDLAQNQHLLDDVLDEVLLAHFETNGSPDPQNAVDQLSARARFSLLKEILAADEEENQDTDTE